MSGDETPRNDLWTVLSIAVVCFVGAQIAHELVGHGLTCQLIGAQWSGVSSSWHDCNAMALPIARYRAVLAGGTVINLTVGTGAWLAVRLHPRRGSLTYFLWLTAAVNLLLGAGHLLVDGLLGIGDWGTFLEELPATAVWRMVLTGLGALLYGGSVGVLARSLDRLVGSGPDRRERGRRLALVPYLAIGGGLLTLGALLNAKGPAFAIASAVITLVGTSGLAWLWRLPARSDSAPLPVERNRAWWIAGAAAALLLLIVLGPGIQWGGAT